jgi:hypothetical protein
VSSARSRVTEPCAVTWMPERRSAKARSTAAFSATAVPQLAVTTAQKVIARRATSAGGYPPAGASGQRSKALRRKPATIISASAMATTIAIRRKSFMTYPRSHTAARSRAGDGAPTARDVPLRDAYRVVRGVGAAGRDGSRSGAAGRTADARRDASTALRERARTRCFFATEKTRIADPVCSAANAAR